MSIHRLPISLEETWKFFSDPRNLAHITPPELNLKVTNTLYGPEMYPGQVMTYRVKPVLGIPMEWMTEITHVEKERMFVDEQRKGPYVLWHHQHHFKAIEGGVEMTDLVHYRLPLGFIGDLFHPVIVKGKLREIFEFRYRAINEKFGEWPGGKIDIRLQ